MRKQAWRIYLFWIALTEVVGIVVSSMISKGILIYQLTVKKPFLTPPSIVFPIVWTILYALMGIGIARIRIKDRDSLKATQIYLLQLIVNGLWSIFFFNFQAFGFSFYWLILLWLLIYRMIQIFKEYDLLAAYLQVPYLLWVTFAGYLNYMIWLIN